MAAWIYRFEEVIHEVNDLPSPGYIREYEFNKILTKQIGIAKNLTADDYEAIDRLYKQVIKDGEFYPYGSGSQF